MNKADSSSAGAGRIAVFDVCDTLYRANTTRGFLRFFHEARRGSSFARTEWAWTSRSSPLFYVGAVAYRWLGRDIARRMLLLTLRGARREELRAVARDYAATVLPAKRVEALHEKLREHREAGDRVVLISNSLDVVVEQIAENLGVEWSASRLAYAGDVCTGTLALDLTGRKAGELRRLDPERSSTLFVYTDNRSDLDLLNEADFPTVILPFGRGRSAWKGQKFDFLEA